MMDMSISFLVMLPASSQPDPNAADLLSMDLGRLAEQTL